LTGQRAAASIASLDASPSRAIGVDLRTALALLVALVLSGCASTRDVPQAPRLTEPRKATLEEVLAAHDAYCSAIQTFSGSGDLQLQDLRTGRSRKLGVRFVASRGGRLYLKGSVLVVTALEVVSDGERFWFQVPSKKKVWTGRSEAKNAAEGADQAPYYALSPRDVTAAFLPEVLAPHEGEALVFEADAEAFSLSLSRIEQRRGIAERRVWLDRGTLRLTRSRAYDEAGNVVTEASFSGWTEGAPRVVTIARPALGYVASFALDKAETNVAIPDRAFVPRTPEGYTLEEVRD